MQRKDFLTIIIVNFQFKGSYERAYITGPCVTMETVVIHAFMLLHL